MNNVIQNILSRRSIRSYQEAQISDEDLSNILEAAKFAPSGSNAQSWHFLVIQNREMLSKLNELVKSAYSRVVIDENTYISIKNGRLASQNPGYNFYYKAPTLIVATNHRTHPNAMADCSCALQNVFLSAHALGLGSCWINQLRWFNDDLEIRKLLIGIGMPDNHVICGAAAIGYPRDTLPKAAPRKDNTVTIVK